VGRPLDKPGQARSDRIGGFDLSIGLILRGTVLALRRCRFFLSLRWPAALEAIIGKASAGL